MPTIGKDIDLCKLKGYFSDVFLINFNLFYWLDGYEFESWKKFFEYTKQQESKIILVEFIILYEEILWHPLGEKRVKSAAIAAASTKDKKGASGKQERGKVSFFFLLSSIKSIDLLELILARS